MSVKVLYKTTATATGGPVSTPTDVPRTTSSEPDTRIERTTELGGPAGSVTVRADTPWTTIPFGAFPGRSMRATIPPLTSAPATIVSSVRAIRVELRRPGEARKSASRVHQ